MTIILWLENCLKTKPTTKDIVKLILCYLKTNFPNQEKLPDFDFKQNLVNFMNFVFKMQLKDIYVYNFRDNNGTIFEYDIDGFNGLVQPNKRFFEASAIFMEYIY